MQNIPVTKLINSDSGDLSSDQQQDMAEIYARLKSIARGQRVKVSDAGFNTTALVNEAWLKSKKNQKTFENRDHFFAYCAVAMRHLLYNQAKRNQLVTFVALDPERTRQPVQAQSDFLIDLEAHLLELKNFQPRLEQVFTFKYFGDMNFASIARVLDISERTALRDWKKARTMISVALAA